MIIFLKFKRWFWSEEKR